MDIVDNTIKIAICLAVVLMCTVIIALCVASIYPHLVFLNVLFLLLKIEAILIAGVGILLFLDTIFLILLHGS